MSSAEDVGDSVQGWSTCLGGKVERTGLVQPGKRTPHSSHPFPTRKFSGKFQISKVAHSEQRDTVQKPKERFKFFEGHKNDQRAGAAPLSGKPESWGFSA